MTEGRPSGFVFKLTPKGIVGASFIDPLRQMNSDARAQLATELRHAAQALDDANIFQALWPLGRALEQLGFTVSRDEESEAR